LQKLNYYSLIWIQNGNGKVKADFSEYDFVASSLFAFSPYQPFMLVDKEPIKVVVNRFTTIYTH
jgi:AraC family transcriptional regulator, transcriptional activator of pobA